jgi:hypothetical protein
MRRAPRSSERGAGSHAACLAWRDEWGRLSLCVVVRFLASGEQLFYRGLMSDAVEDVSLSQYDERTRRGLERIQPHNLGH